MKRKSEPVTTDVTLKVRQQTRLRVQRFREQKKRKAALESVTLSAVTHGNEKGGPEPIPFVLPVRAYEDIPNAIRKRREELGLSQLEVDELAGTQTGYCGKVEQPKKNYGRVMGDLAFKLILTALGLKMMLVESAPANKRFADRVKVGTRRRGANGGKKRS